MSVYVLKKQILAHPDFVEARIELNESVSPYLSGSLLITDCFDYVWALKFEQCFGGQFVFTLTDKEMCETRDFTPLSMDNLYRVLWLQSVARLASAREEERD